MAIPDVLVTLRFRLVVEILLRNCGLRLKFRRLSRVSNTNFVPLSLFLVSLHLPVSTRFVRSTPCFALAEHKVRVSGCSSPRFTIERRRAASSLAFPPANLPSFPAFRPVVERARATSVHFRWRVVPLESGNHDLEKNCRDKTKRKKGNEAPLTIEGYAVTYLQIDVRTSVRRGYRSGWRE